MLSALRRRYYDVLASVYLYNEYRGYTGLERLLAALRERYSYEAGIHYWLMLLKIPILFLSIRKSRLVTFPA